MSFLDGVPVKQTMKEKWLDAIELIQSNETYTILRKCQEVLEWNNHESIYLSLWNIHSFTLSVPNFTKSHFV